MKINGFYLFLLIFLIMVVLASIFYPLRYLKYILPLLALPVYIKNKELPIDKNIFWYFYTFIIFYACLVVYLLFQNLLFSELSARFFPNAVFVLAPLLFVTFIIPYFNPDKIKDYISLIFFINILIFLFEESEGIFLALSHPEILKDAIITSEFPTESNLAYVFGFFVIYFVIGKYPGRYKWLSIIFFILCFKRIVIFAVLVSCIAYFVVSKLKIDLVRYRKTLTFLGIALNLLFIKLTHLIATGTFDAFVLEKTGLSTDRFTMGRKTFYSEVFSKAGEMNWQGLGMGKVDDIMFNFYGIPINLHSEVLKNYFEFGIILFVIWLFLTFYKSLFSNKAVVLLLYFNILLLTDNVFIYFEIMFYFYFFILIFLHQNLALKTRENESFNP